MKTPHTYNGFEELEHLMVNAATTDAAHEGDVAAHTHEDWDVFFPDTAF
ncbi:hypothetical protein [Flavobacterium magnum]|nr:hypothetical protein [Flavobacterium magnum]